MRKYEMKRTGRWYGLGGGSEENRNIQVGRKSTDRPDIQKLIHVKIGEQPAWKEDLVKLRMAKKHQAELQAADEQRDHADPQLLPLGQDDHQRQPKTFREKSKHHKLKQLIKA